MLIHNYNRKLSLNKKCIIESCNHFKLLQDTYNAAIHSKDNSKRPHTSSSSCSTTATGGAPASSSQHNSRAIQQNSNLKAATTTASATLSKSGGKLGASSTPPSSQQSLHYHQSSQQQMTRGQQYEGGRMTAPSQHQEQQAAQYKHFCKYEGKTQPTAHHHHHHHHFSQPQSSSRLVTSLEHENELSSHYGKSCQQRSASSSAILANTTRVLPSHFSKSHSMMISSSTPHQHNFGHNSEEQISLPPPIPPLPTNYQRSDGNII